MFPLIHFPRQFSDFCGCNLFDSMLLCAMKDVAMHMS